MYPEKTANLVQVTGVCVSSIRDFTNVLRRLIRIVILQRFLKKKKFVFLQLIYMYIYIYIYIWLFVGKPEGKRPHGKPKCRWEDNIKIYL